MSTTNISMTAVHIIIGAVRDSLVYSKVAKAQGGESEFNRELVEYAPRIERVYQVLSGKYDFGHWLIDVVENFGASCLDRAWLGCISEAYFRQFMLYASAATSNGIDAADIETAREAWHGPASPFAETYGSAWISTAHITPRTLDGLNALQASETLPFWISPTLYGWIVRFDALALYGLSDDDGSVIKRLASAPDLLAIRDLLAAHGLQAAHLDADGPLITGLEQFDH